MFSGQLRLGLVAPLLLLSSSAGFAALGGPVVGFERVQMVDGTEVGIWYPAAGSAETQRIGLYEHTVVRGAEVQGEALPLVVMSHGTGGHFTGHLDTASALAGAGFVVAALTHPGDNWRDSSGATQVERRPKDLSALITFMLGSWPSHAKINAKNVGAFGFSAGGFTVLTVAGAQPDLSRIAPHCAANPQFFDCAMISRQPQTGPRLWAHQKDARIKAISVAAPALGFTFTPRGLGPLSIPVQLWRAAADRVLPAPHYADAVKAALPTPAEYHDVPGAGHFDFLAPCADRNLNPQVCDSAADFDRAAFHQRFNANVVRFFVWHLGGLN